MRKLNQTTKEFLDVTVIDDQQTLTTLDGLGLQYQIMNEDDGVQLAWTAGLNLGMTAFCLADTNTPTLWTEGNYRLFVRFTLAPEIPVIGPMNFQVVAL